MSKLLLILSLFVSVSAMAQAQVHDFQTCTAFLFQYTDMTLEDVDETCRLAHNDFEIQRCVVVGYLNKMPGKQAAAMCLMGIEQRENPCMTKMESAGFSSDMASKICH